MKLIGYTTGDGIHFGVSGNRSFMIQNNDKAGPGPFHFFRLRPSVSGTSNCKAFIFR